MRRLPLVVLLLAACVAATVASAADPERILVTNARLVGRVTAAKDIAVNVLIVGGRLSVVTKDELVIGPGDTAVDSNGGFLFGQLNLGSRPSFVILDEDPRENVDVLLDTKTYARFAIREGVIVKNELQAIAESSRGEVALGLLISNNDTEYEIELCPPSDTVCSGNAHIVVLCQRA